jgi:hypothetical protein
MQQKRVFPFYPLVLALFPALALLLNNRTEVDLDVVFRPAVFSILLAGVVFLLAYLVIRRDWHRGALFAGVTLILFFSYGHLFNLIQASEALSPVLGRHRILMGLFALIWISALILSFFKAVSRDFSLLMNIFSLILIAFPIFQLGYYYINEGIARRKLAQASAADTFTAGDETLVKPDVYYIILDTYTRPDALLELYDYDVSDFIHKMEDFGFYFADCSHSNYGETYGSISSSLNMNYLDDLLIELNTLAESPLAQDLIKSNRVMDYFDDLGYETIAFSTTYKWSEITDADVYHDIIGANRLRNLSPFEIMFFESLIIYPFRGYVYQIFPNPYTEQIVNSPFALHVDTQYYIMDTLPLIPQNPEPTFTFAHILIPHVPYVFRPDGSLQTDPGYWEGRMADAVNDTYRLDGFISNIGYVNQQMLSIVEEILRESDTPPVIIIQGDHGWRKPERYQILNLYYFPDQDYGLLHKGITPVNSFRVVFNTIFDLSMPLLEEKVFLKEGPVLIEDLMEDCP